jgi:hypothetical protein
MLSVLLSTLSENAAFRLSIRPKHILLYAPLFALITALLEAIPVTSLISRTANTI